MKFSEAKISRKLAIAFSVVLGIFALSCTTLFFSLNAAHEAAAKNNRSYRNSELVDGMLSAAIEQQNALRAYLLTADQEHLENYAKQGQRADGFIADFQANTTQPAQRERATRLAAALEEWRRMQGDRQIALMQDPATRGEAHALTGTLRLTKVREAHAELDKDRKSVV